MKDLIPNVSFDCLEAMAINLVRAGINKDVVLQGHTENGWDTEAVKTEEDVQAYFSFQERHGNGKITLWVNQQPIAFNNQLIGLTKRGCPE